MSKPKQSSTTQFEETMDEAQRWAKSVGLTQSDVDETIKSVRDSKKREGC